ncbi:MAG: PQQ-dependent dehydrogenase, methanol/ethanol family [Vicinamibacterales bacterium]
MRRGERRLAVLAVLFAAGLAAAQQRPVDDGTLRHPPAGEWVTHGYDYAETRHSPLEQINQGNVAQLQKAWSVEVGANGKLETTPLYSNGVLYGTSTYGIVFAIDARNGSLKWRWDPALVRGGIADGAARFCCGPVNRGLALYKGRVYVGLLDGRLVALDAETGYVSWAVQTTPVGRDYSITGAPRIVKGRVVIGNGGGEYGVRGYLTAYDAESGKQAWRWWVVPGDPSKGLEDRSMEVALKTWKGEWWKYGGGGTPWDAIAYDPDANLVYVGTGNGSPWSRDHRSQGEGDNLYLSSIVALNADTGRYVWHYQTTPGDDWDYNAAQHMILADLTISGRVRKVLMQAPKNGFFYVIDRLTGELISAQPFTTVTWATHIDLKTGRPVETPEGRYAQRAMRISPAAVGAHHWPPMAYNPKTGLVYFPGQDTSMIYQSAPAMEFKEGQWNTGTQRSGQRPTKTGFFVAWDPVQNQERWRIEFGEGGGVLSTAGDLIFVGANAGNFVALDPLGGKTLWEAKVLTGVATPITYELDGKQYVAVVSGISTGTVFAFTLP